MLEEAIELARQNALNICTKAAQTIHAEKVEPYCRIEINDLAQRILGGLEMQFRYLLSYDLDEWKEYCTKTITAGTNAGIPYAGTMWAGQILISKQLEFYQETLTADPTMKLGGQPARKILEKLERRLQALDSVSTSVTIAVGRKQNPRLIPT